MMDLEKIARRIASLRRERGYTGEALAERLQVSPRIQMGEREMPAGDGHPSGPGGGVGLQH